MSKEEKNVENGSNGNEFNDAIPIS